MFFVLLLLGRMMSTEQSRGPTQPCSTRSSFSSVPCSAWSSLGEAAVCKVLLSFFSVNNYLGCIWCFIIYTYIIYSYKHLSDAISARAVCFKLYRLQSFCIILHCIGDMSIIVDGLMDSMLIALYLEYSKNFEVKGKLTSTTTNV